MRKVLVVLALLAATRSVGAGEVAVNWKIAGARFVSDNRLPAGAVVKVRVVHVKDAFGRDFTVNGTKFTAKKKGDEFRARVGRDGKLEIGSVFKADRIGSLPETTL